MPEKEITLTELATLVKANTVSIGDVARSVEELARMTKEGFDAVTSHLRAHDKQFESIDKRFDKIELRLERIELIFLTDHKKRIERLEDQVKELMMAGR